MTSFAQIADMCHGYMETLQINFGHISDQILVDAVSYLGAIAMWEDPEVTLIQKLQARTYCYLKVQEYGDVNFPPFDMAFWGTVSLINLAEKNYNANATLAAQPANHIKRGLSGPSPLRPPSLIKVRKSGQSDFVDFFFNLFFFLLPSPLP